MKHKIVMLYLFALFFNPPSEASVSLPEFTPNVVDSAELLNSSEVSEINRRIVELQNSVHLKAAVYILKSLEGESIDSLAERSFRTWKLGAKKEDNGLLLILAISERKSRIEVGYGLEGEITDLISRRALDEYLRPSFKKQAYREGILNTLNFIASRLKGGEQIVVKSKQPSLGDFIKTGFYFWLAFVIFLWGLMPTMQFIERRRKEKLKLAISQTLDFKMTTRLTQILETPILKKMPISLRLFLTLNPGIFIILLIDLFAKGSNALISIIGVSMAGVFFCIYLFLENSIRFLKSIEKFKAYLEELTLRNQELIKKGHMKMAEDGSLSYTEKYYEATRRSSISDSFESSSSSSDSSSSSSDGGSSGGGGSSSDW